SKPHVVGIVGAVGDLLQPGAVEPHPRTFTREEAEGLLPEVDRLLGQAQTLRARLGTAEQAAQSEQWTVRSNGKVHPEATAETAETTRRTVARQLRALLERLQGLGIVVRDVESGLIDFPSVRDGRIIHLCWRRGEPLEIRWWHEVAAGFAGRQPL
ncbi:MAG TPA: DUF2203 domain-containing protein, partial [Chloroflexota bacterium]|nr:DUF2203 domain-containing protein [Chloroflexota bacterium]